MTLRASGPNEPGRHETRQVDSGPRVFPCWFWLPSSTNAGKSRETSKAPMPLLNESIESRAESRQDLVVVGRQEGSETLSDYEAGSCNS